MPTSLSQISIDESNLSLLVLGPGCGESIVVLAPTKQAIVVDSFLAPQTASGECPPLEFLKRNGYSIAVSALTHPHYDHAEGFDRIVHHCKGPVGCGPKFLERLNPKDPNAALKDGWKKQALAAIHNKWENTKSAEWPLLAPGSVSVGDVTVTALHPTEENSKVLKGENALSSPLLIEWSSVRLLLGADLPTSCWELIDTSFRVHEHSAFKVAHHTSINNVHPQVQGGNGPRDRYWIGTPYRRKPQPPRFEDDRGIQVLVKSVEQVHMTSILFDPGQDTSKPVSRKSLETAAEALKAKKKKKKLPGQRSRVPLAQPREPEEAWVLLSWNKDGQVQGLQRGSQSVIVVEN